MFFYYATSLLIEPVWNRNARIRQAIAESGKTFNRTSLESKPFSDDGACWRGGTFNRTSLESKQRFCYLCEQLNTFNRTSLESKRSLDFSIACGGNLLIEPVWNRNISDISNQKECKNSF